MEKIRTLFIGTSSFAVPTLKALSEADFIDLVGVVTQPDKPFGRDQKLTPPPVKDEARKLNLNIPIFQPEKLRAQSQEILEKTNPELIIVASYGQMVPANMIHFPKYKCLNIHCSILPDLRGAVPMPMAILKGYKKTGVSIPVMTEGLDDGDIVALVEEEIRFDETTESLTERLSEIGAKKLIEILPEWTEGKITPIPQDESKVTHTTADDISKDKAEVDWNKSAEEVDRMVRAFYPWPVAWSWVNFNGQKRFKIYKATLSDFESDKKPGEFFKKDKNLFVQTGKGSLELVEVQLEGKAKDDAKNYLYLIT